jgi:hypothetical protein
MSHSNLTRWIETADAKGYQGTMLDRERGAPRRSIAHPCASAGKVPAWLPHAISCESLAAIGCHALALVRHSRGRLER